MGGHMNHAAILAASQVLPRDHQVGILRQTERLSALIAELEAMAPGSAEAAAKLHEAHVLAQNMYTEAAGHANNSRPDRWFLTALGALNACAERHGLERARRPFEL